MYLRIASVLVVLFVMGPLINVVQADSPFSDCTSQTDTRAIITLPQDAEPSIDDAYLPEGAEIAAYTPDGVCAGLVTWEGESLALIVWGSDSQTEEKDGFANGEPISFRIWDPSTDEVYDEEALSFSFSRDRSFFASDNVYQEGGIYVFSEFGVHTDRTPTQIEFVYPNPAMDHAMVQIHLQDDSHVRIQVFDVLGRLLTTLIDEELSEGAHAVEWNTEDAVGTPVGSGTYFIRMQHPADSETSAVTVVR